MIPFSSAQSLSRRGTNPGSWSSVHFCLNIKKGGCIMCIQSEQKRSIRRISFTDSSLWFWSGKNAVIVNECKMRRIRLRESADVDQWTSRWARSIMTNQREAHSYLSIDPLDSHRSADQLCWFMILEMSESKERFTRSRTCAYPWRCLCFGFWQIIITCLWRRISRQFSQIFRTELRTFIFNLQ